MKALKIGLAVVRRILSWLLLVPLWRLLSRRFRKLWRWAGEIDDRTKARKKELEEAREQAAQAAGFENARAERAAERAARKAADKVRKDADKVRKDAEKAQWRAERGKRAVEALDKERIKDAKKLGIDVRFLSEYRTLSTTAIGAKEARKLFQALGTPDGKFASPVIVRSYASMPGLRAEALMQIDAQVLAKYGYFPTSQSFAAVNALTSLAGMGYLTVTYVKQGTGSPPSPR